MFQPKERLVPAWKDVSTIMMIYKPINISSNLFFVENESIYI